MKLAAGLPGIIARLKAGAVGSAVLKHEAKEAGTALVLRQIVGRIGEIAEEPIVTSLSRAEWIGNEIGGQFQVRDHLEDDWIGRDIQANAKDAASPVGKDRSCAGFGSNFECVAELEQLAAIE